MTKFVFNIDPVEQARPRATIIKVYDNAKRRFKNSVRMYDPKKVVEYKALLKMLAIQERKIKKYQLIEKDKPIHVSIVFYRPIQRSLSKVEKERRAKGTIYPTVKPDLDNYIKSTFDALNGVLWHDDNNIVSIHAMKMYSDKPRIEITISENIPKWE